MGVSLFNMLYQKNSNYKGYKIKGYILGDYEIK